MADRDVRDDQADEQLDLGLLIESDVWQRSMPSTVWDALKGADQEAVEYFARRYATPIYCYFRRHRLQRDEAKDLTQGFLVDKLILGRLLEKFDAGRHRFRPYLLRALKNYLTDHFRRVGRAQVIRVGQTLEYGPNLEPEVEGDAEREFICQWAHGQITEAILRVKSECRQDGLGDHFRMFCLRLFKKPRPRWEAIGQQFGVGRQEAKNKAWTVRDRLRKAVLEEFTLPGMTESQVMDDVRELIAIFRNHPVADFLSETWTE